MTSGFMGDFSEKNLFSLAKMLLAIVCFPLLSLAAGIAIGSIILALTAFFVANPFVAFSIVAKFLIKKANGAGTDSALLESGGTALANPDILRKLWDKISDILN